MKYKFNPLTGEFNLVPDSGTLKQKLNWFTGNFNLTKDAGKYKQIYNAIEGEFNLRPAVTQVIVHGIGSIQLTNAVENGLLSLTAYGGTEQRSSLPSGYTQLEYTIIPSGGYLTTDFVPTYDCKVELEFTTTTLGASGATTYLGVRPDTTGNGGLRCARISSQVFRIYGFGSYQDSTNTVAANTRYKFTWDNQRGIVTTGSTTVFDKTYSNTGSNTYPLTINGWNSAGTVTVGAESIYVHSFKAWDNQGVLAANYIPCVYNNEVGFYDTVSESFKGATGGTFTAGPNAAPTPEMPMDIVSNNGILKARDSELPVGYKRVLGYTCNNDVLWQITDFHLRGSDTVRISFSVTTGCNVFGCYQGTDANDNYDLYVSVSSGAKYLRYGNGTYLSYWSNANLGERFDVVFSSTGTSGMPTDSTWTPMTFESANDLLLGATTLTGTSSKLKGNLYGDFIVDGRLKLIPCERLSDNSLGYYDTYSGTFFEPTGTPTSLGYDYTHTQIYIDGITETIEITGKNLNGGGALDNKGYTSTGGTSNSSTFCGTLWKIKVKEGEKYTLSYGNFPDGVSGVFINTWKTDGTWNLRQAISIGSSYTYTIPSDIGEVNFTLYKTGGITIGSNSWMQVEKGTTPSTYEPYYYGGAATAEMLLKVGDYVDEQEILSGNVTRNVGIKVFNGSENFGTSNATFTYAISDRVPSKITLICSHFGYSTKTSSQVEDLKAISFSSTNIGFRYDACANTTAFKAWLTSQYNNGTPVIVIYPLAISTTETVEGQALDIQDGNNTIEITQASLDNLELEATYEQEA